MRVCGALQGCEYPNLSTPILHVLGIYIQQHRIGSGYCQQFGRTFCYEFGWYTYMG